MRVLRWRKNGAILSAGILAVTMCGCGNNKSSAPEVASTQEKVLSETEPLPEYNVSSDVQLPDHFDNMIYPIEAVMVEYYSQGLPYYKSGDDQTSFWFSMAVLSTLMTEDGIISPDIDDQFCTYKSEEIQVFASTLYHDFLAGKFTLPAPGDDDPYVTYDSDTGLYGLLDGNVGDLDINITRCSEVSDGYLLNTELINGDSGGMLTEFQIKIKPVRDVTEQESSSQNTKAADQDGVQAATDLFSYSVCSMTEVTEKFSEEDTSAESGTTEMSDDISETDMDDDVADDSSDNDIEQGDADLNMGDDLIDRDDALTMAKDYLGDDAKCTFKRMVSIGNYEYYDFSVADADSSSTDILVCADGSDVVTGVENDDGSWSFDQ